MDELLAILGRFVQVRPKVEWKNGKFIARTAWSGHLFSFGFGSRRVEVDPKAKTVRMWSRTWWFVTRVKRIQFDWVQAVLYGYSDLGGGEWQTHRAVDLFTVGLRLKNGDVVTLLRFAGQGDFVNASVLPDAFFWSEYALTPIVQGSQEGRSANVAEILERLIGVPIEDFYGSD